MSDLKHLKLPRRFFRVSFVFTSEVFWGLYIQETGVIHSILQGVSIVTFLMAKNMYMYLKSLRLFIMLFDDMFFI